MTHKAKKKKREKESQLAVRGEQEGLLPHIVKKKKREKKSQLAVRGGQEGLLPHKAKKTKREKKSQLAVRGGQEGLLPHKAKKTKREKKSQLAVRGGQEGLLPHKAKKNKKEKKSQLAVRGGQEGPLPHTTKNKKREKKSQLDVRGGQEGLLPHKAKKKKRAKKSQLAVRGGQEGLLPGIPDEVTMQNIAPRLKWKTSKVMQTVSRGWRCALRNRIVYEARVLSKRIEAFLVIVLRQSPILYSCEDGSSLALPPIPFGTCRDPSCICFGGRIHVWTITDSGLRRGFVRRGFMLNLHGDMKWIQFSQEECSNDPLPDGQGLLDGKVYHFDGSNYKDCAVLSTGRYEPFFSEWKERQSTDHSNLPINTAYHNGQTSQVYFCNPIKDPVRDKDHGFDTDLFYEELLISGGKLLKVVTLMYDMIEYCEDESPLAEIEVYDPDNGTWKPWKSFKRTVEISGLKNSDEDEDDSDADQDGLDEDSYFCYTIFELVAVDNDVWALVYTWDHKWCLYKSPELLREDNDDPIMWISTGYSIEHCYGDSTLRPIFV